MSTSVTVPWSELQRTVHDAFVAADTAPDNAAAVAAALVLAEADGQQGHGLSRVASYRAQSQSGKVRGHAVPQPQRLRPACVLVDAACGFFYPALALGLPLLIEAAREQGIAALGIANSHHAGVAGQPVERLARNGLLGLMLANTPAAIAPWGGNRALFGTNPLAFACPRLDQMADPLVIDMALSKQARGKIVQAANKGATIPKGWAFDAQGQPTEDPQAALEGSLAPMADAKGAQLALMVEILAASLVGAHFGHEASSFFSADGPAPRVGQCLIAIAPNAFGHEQTLSRIEALLGAINMQPGTRLPGAQRFARRNEVLQNGFTVPTSLYESLKL